jgi:hypothetical protein
MRNKLNSLNNDILKISKKTLKNISIAAITAFTVATFMSSLSSDQSFSDFKTKIVNDTYSNSDSDSLDSIQKLKEHNLNNAYSLIVDDSEFDSKIKKILLDKLKRVIVITSDTSILNEITKFKEKIKYFNSNNFFNPNPDIYPPLSIEELTILTKDIEYFSNKIKYLDSKLDSSSIDKLDKNDPLYAISHIIYNIEKNNINNLKSEIDSVEEDIKDSGIQTTLDLDNEDKREQKQRDEMEALLNHS